MAQETDVETEVVAQEIAQDPQQDSTALSQEELVKQDQEMNWKKARELMEEQKRQLEILKERERRYQEELQRASKKQSVEEEEEELRLSKDDLLTVGQWEKLTEKTLKKYFQKQEDNSAESRLRQEYSDYDAVVTPENLERLAKDNPEAVETLQANTRMYAKAKTAYLMLKTMYGSSATTENREKLQANLAKPRAASSTGSTGALSQAHAFERGLTPELKKQLLQEMIAAKKRS